MTARIGRRSRGSAARAVLAVALALAIVLPARAARADAFETIGAGSRASAMLASSALAEGAPAVFYDPAGIVAVTDAEISLAFAYTEVNLTINGRDTDEEEITGTTIGIAYPTSLFDQKVALGVLFYVPSQRVSRLLALPLDQPQFLYYGTRNQRMVLMAAGGVQVTDWLSLGAGLQTLIDTFSEPDFTLVQDPDSSNDLTDPGADAREPRSFGFASVIEKTVIAPLAGIRLGPVAGLRLGATYRGEVRANLSAPFLVSIEEVYLLGLETPLAQSRFILPNSADLFFSPNQVALGLAYASRDEVWKVDLDLTWFQWSRFPPTFSEATPVFDGGLGQIILPVPGFLPIKPPTRDVVVPAVGAEWLAHRGESVELALRGGYSYRPSILEEDRSLTNYLDPTSHILGMGFGLKLKDWSRFVPKPLSIDGYFQVHVLEERDIRKDDPASSPYGDLRIGGLLLGGGLQATVRF